MSDHLAREIPELLAHAAAGRLDLGLIVSRFVPLAAAVNTALDDLAAFRGPTRKVIELG